MPSVVRLMIPSWSLALDASTALNVFFFLSRISLIQADRTVFSSSDISG